MVEVLPTLQTESQDPVTSCSRSGAVSECEFQSEANKHKKHFYSKYRFLLKFTCGLPVFQSHWVRKTFAQNPEFLRGATAEQRAGQTGVRDRGQRVSVAVGVGLCVTGAEVPGDAEADEGSCEFLLTPMHYLPDLKKKIYT